MFSALQKDLMITKDLATFTKLWEIEARNLPWFTPWNSTLDWNEPWARWFVGGTLNACYACVDVHMNSARKNKPAIIWEDERGTTQTYTYAQLHERINTYASAFRSVGITKGSVVILYLPHIPEAIITMLALARLGAIHSVVFSGFSAQALRERLTDTQAAYIVTADVTLRRGKQIQLKAIVDDALQEKSTVRTVLVLQRSATPLALASGRDQLLNTLVNKSYPPLAPEPVESNHPLFILYTSGTTGKPKGIVHGTGGYLTYALSTFRATFNPAEDARYWCTADLGWITGHSYGVYAPLMHGATLFMFEGVPDNPSDGWWRLIAKHKISIFYTSPTLIRMCMKTDPKLITQHDLTSLTTLGSVGEPINPQAWHWFFEVIGGKRCPIIDTWWQTETGGFMIAPTKSTPISALKPGSALSPLLGIAADIVDEQGKPVPANTKGFLVINHPWPGLTQGVWGNPQRFIDSYWTRFTGRYATNDFAIRDHDGHFWILGRADDIINVAGHCIGSAEVERAATAHPAVLEAAAIRVKDEIKGENIALFIILKPATVASETINPEIIGLIRSKIGPFATPKEIYTVTTLPKTRSGKIMRRVLAAQLAGEEIGNLMTMDDGG